MKNCQRCDGPLADTDKTCPQCGRPAAAGAALASVATKPLPCPVCKLPMFPATIESLEAIHCAECQGAALKRESMMKLSPHGPKTIELDGAERDYKRPPFFEPRSRPPFLICPFCHKRMKEVKLGALKVDICDECSAIWLSRFETEHLNNVIGPYKWRMTKS